MKRVFQTTLTLMAFVLFAFNAWGTEPECGPLGPQYEANQVKGVYSGYLSCNCNFAEWGSGTAFYDGIGHSKKISTGVLGYFGMEFTSINCSQMEGLSMSVWFETPGSFRVVPIHGGPEKGVTVTIGETDVNMWKVIELPFNQGDFSQVTDWSNVYQIKIDNVPDKAFWIDEVFFYTSQTIASDTEAPTNLTVTVGEKGFTFIQLHLSATDNSGAVTYEVSASGMPKHTFNGASGATVDAIISGLTAGTNYILQIDVRDESGNEGDGSMKSAQTNSLPSAAPVPARAAANVVSLFSDAYTPGASFNVGSWGQSTQCLPGKASATDNIYECIYPNYLGWEINGNTAVQGISDFDGIHMDIYAHQTSVVEFTPIWGAEALKSYSLAAGWNSLDIPFTDFAGINPSNIYQIKWANMPGMLLDNVYFYKEAAPELPEALNPYAFQVSASANGKVLTVNYSLNVDAEDAYLGLFNTAGEKVLEKQLTGLTKGAHSETVDLTGESLENGAYTAKVGVVGKAHKFTTYADSTVTYNNRAHATVDAYPTSPNFGNIYLTCRYGKIGIFRITPDYQYINTTQEMLGQTSWASVQRGAVAPNGEMWFSSWGDANSGIYRYDPSVDAENCTQFFEGTRNAKGLIVNNGVEVGCSTPGIDIYAAGADSKLYMVAEDFTDGDTKGSLAIYNIGKADGSIVTSWGTAPSAHYNTLTDNTNTNFAVAATPYGAWLGQNRSKGGNLSSARSLQFIGNDGVQKYLSTDTALINGSFGSAVCTNAAYDKLWLVNGDGNILEFNVAWNEGTPALTLAATHVTPFAAIAQMTFDYAGNIVSVAGTGYSTNSAVLRLAVFSLPTDEAPEVVTPIVGFTFEMVPTGLIDENDNLRRTEKLIINGQLIIIRDGVRYNAMGQIVE